MLQLGRDTTVNAADGKSWTFSRLELGLIERFAAHCREAEGDPFELLDRMGEKMPPEVWAKEYAAAKELRDQLRCFSLSSPLAEKHLNTAPGAAFFARLWLERRHPKIDAGEALLVWLALQDSGELPAVLAACTGRTLKRPESVPGEAGEGPEGNAPGPGPSSACPTGG